MTMLMAVTGQDSPEVRWQKWLARGEQQESRRRRRQRAATIVLFAGLALWLLVEIMSG